jgi:5S rRNA maturation endonuclease (ribonuclease M5)
MSAISSQQRHKRQHPCPICGGAENDQRGKEKRCYGFTSADGEWVHCMRPEHAGVLSPNDMGAYVHKMHGPCNCGRTHGEDFRQRDEIESTYDYVDERGKLLFQVVRKTGKRFLQRRPDGAGGWIWQLGETRRVLYRLRELLASGPETPIVIAEGEKDADALARRGFVSTCNPGGAGKWPAVADLARSVLAGRDVIVIADRDDVGRSHARHVEATLRSVARSVRVLVPEAPHKDVSDVFAASGGMGDLVEIDAAPEPTATEPSFRVWTPAEIWKELEPPDYLMDGLLVRGSLALIVAYGSSLKTWVLEDGALSVATGGQWMARFDTKKTPALIIDFESGDYELRRRAHRLARGRELQIPIDGFAFITMPSLNLASDAFFDALRPLAKKYGFIGIDSLAAGSGGIDENDTRFATSLNRLKGIAAESGCVIVVLHHSRKGSGEDADPREMVRGTSAIFNAVDVVLQMSRKDDGFVVRQTKARGGKTVDPFVVRVDDTAPDASVVRASNAPDADGENIENASKAIERAKREVLMLLAREHGLTSKTQLYSRIHGTKGTKISALAELIELGTVTEHEGAFRLASEVRL